MAAITATGYCGRGRGRARLLAAGPSRSHLVVEADAPPGVDQRVEQCRGRRGHRGAARQVVDHGQLAVVGVGDDRTRLGAHERPAQVVPHAVSRRAAVDESIEGALRDRAQVERGRAQGPELPPPERLGGQAGDGDQGLGDVVATRVAQGQTVDGRAPAPHGRVGAAVGQVDHELGQVRWEPVLRDDRWQAEYFNNITLQGTPALSRADAAIDFNWQFGSPAANIAANEFSARWTRTVNFAPGTYRFTMTGDDGVRLWINENLFMEAWYEQSQRSYTDTIYLSGPTSLRMEYFELRGLAVAGLRWESLSN